jgi:hypothetical protein
MSDDPRLKIGHRAVLPGSFGVGKGRETKKSRNCKRGGDLEKKTRDNAEAVGRRVGELCAERGRVGERVEDLD